MPLNSIKKIDVSIHSKTDVVLFEKLFFLTFIIYTKNKIKSNEVTYLHNLFVSSPGFSNENTKISENENSVEFTRCYHYDYKNDEQEIKKLVSVDKKIALETLLK